jgi:hypothetical protein
VALAKIQALLVFVLALVCRQKPNVLECALAVFTMRHNGYVYETFGISKHFPVKLQALLIRAEMFDNPLTAKCFIYDVTAWCSFIYVIFSFNLLLFSVCRALGQTHLLTSFGRAVGFLSDLAMCVAVKRRHFI